MKKQLYIGRYPRYRGDGLSYGATGDSKGESQVGYEIKPYFTNKFFSLALGGLKNKFFRHLAEHTIQSLL